MSELMQFERATAITYRTTGRPEDGPIWLLVLPVGEFAYRGETRDITEELALAIASETRRAIYLHAERALPGSKPWTPPLRVEHRKDGKRRGDILDAKVSGEGATRGLYLLMSPREATRAAILADEYEFVSVTIGAMEDDAGESYAPVVVELSLVDSPHLSNIGRIQDWLGLELSAASRTHVQTLTEDDMSEIKELTDKINAQAETIATQATTIEGLQADLEGVKLELSKAGEPIEGVVTEIESAPVIDAAQLAEDITAQVVAKLSRPGGVVPGSNAPASPPQTLKAFVDSKVEEGMSRSEAVKLSLGKSFN